MPTRINHYDWLDQHFPLFLERLQLDPERFMGMIGSHGDKCYSYRDIWEKQGIPFPHGVAVYLLCYISRYSGQVRETKEGWVHPWSWVIDNYPKFKEFLPQIPD